MARVPVFRRFPVEQPASCSVLWFRTMLLDLQRKPFIGLPQKVKDGEFDQDLIPLMKLSAARKYVIGQRSINRCWVASAIRSRKAGASSTSRAWPTDCAAVDAAALSSEQQCIGHEVVTLVGPAEVIVLSWKSVAWPMRSTTTRPSEIVSGSSTTRKRGRRS